MAKTTLRYSATLNSVQNEASDVFVGSYLDNKNLTASGRPDIMLFFCAARKFLSNLDRPKEDFLRMYFTRLMHKLLVRFERSFQTYAV